jgi:hypothetical protein
MNAFAAAGAAFLIAVLWFDLMFDVQVRGRSAVAPEALASISPYYRRVTTQARPMNRLVSVVMLFTLVMIGVEIWQSAARQWKPWVALVLTLSAIGLAMTRTVPNAVRLGLAADSHEMRIELARAVYRDHLFCLAAMVLVLVLQLWP